MVLFKVMTLEGIIFASLSVLYAHDFIMVKNYVSFIANNIVF